MKSDSGVVLPDAGAHISNGENLGSGKRHCSRGNAGRSRSDRRHDRQAGNDLPLGTPLAVPSREEMLLRLTAFFASDTGHITLAESDGAIVGLAVGQINLPGLFASAPWLQIELLYVKPEARRHGVGRSLLTEQSLFASAAGAGYIVTQPINGSRSEQRFLSRLGFTAVGSRRTCETALLRRLDREGPRRGLESLIARRRTAVDEVNCSIRNSARRESTPRGRPASRSGG